MGSALRAPRAANDFALPSDAGLDLDARRRVGGGRLLLVLAADAADADDDEGDDEEETVGNKLFDMWVSGVKYHGALQP